MITQRDLDLIQDDRAFTPAPVRIEAGWLEPVCWLAMVVITVAGVAVIGNPIGWFWL